MIIIIFIIAAERPRSLEICEMAEECQTSKTEEGEYLIYIYIYLGVIE